MNDVIEAMLNRRSIRKYKAEMPPKEMIDEIVKAGLYAASGMGRQSAVIAAVTDKALRDRLSDMNRKIGGWDSGFDPFYGAPTVIVVLADQSRGTCVEDGSLVMGTLMNAAYAVGVDSCWIHRAREVFASEEGKALLAQWGIEGDYIGIGHCILGYRDCELPQAKPRKENYIYRV